MSAELLLVIDDSPTVLKVVENALAKAGFQVATAGGGQAGLAAAREADPPPVLVLLDGFMPDMDGAACCQALAAERGLANVPVILMVTKGEDLGEKLAKAPNVVDYITKPFSPEAVVAVVTHVIEKRRAGGQPSGGKPAAVTEALSKSSAAPAGAPGVTVPAATSALHELREQLARRLDGYRQESGKWDLGELVRGAFDDDTLGKLLSDYETRAGPGDGAASGARGDSYALTGDLSAITISEVLSLLQEQNQTGCLRALQTEARVELYLRGGKVDFAAAVGVSEEFLLGRFAIEAGALTPDALTAVLDQRARAATKPGLFGVDLVARGLLTESQLKQAMTRQTSELVYETLRWTTGKFSFRATTDREIPELARGAALGIPVDTLLLEGFRRVDEWRVIEREIDSFDLVFVPNESKIAEVARGQLTRDEIAVLEFVNGRTPVKEIIRTLRMGSFDVSRILYRLLRTKLIRRRVAATAT
jgi:CheY-like chemotaxis protein